MCVFLFAHSFLVQTNKETKYLVTGREMLSSVEFRCLSPLRVSVQHSSVAHIDRHITDRQRAAEVNPPSLSSCVCLGVEVSGDEQQTKANIVKKNVLLTSMTQLPCNKLAKVQLRQYIMGIQANLMEKRQLNTVKLIRLRHQNRHIDMQIRR